MWDRQYGHSMLVGSKAESRGLPSGTGRRRSGGSTTLSITGRCLMRAVRSHHGTSPGSGAVQFRSHSKKLMDGPDEAALPCGCARLRQKIPARQCESPKPLHDAVRTPAAQPSFIALSSNCRQASRSCSTRSRRSRSMPSTGPGTGLLLTNDGTRMPSSSVSTKR
jgi:hypothetical protein